MRYFLIIVLILFLTFCSPYKSPKNVISSFDSIYFRLPEIELPLTIQTIGEPFISRDIPEIKDSVLNKRFGVVNGYVRPLGRIFQNINFRTVLSIMSDDIGTPIITIFDSTGQQIDNLYLLDKIPYSPAFESREIVTISKEGFIYFIDTTKNLNVNNGKVINVEVRKITYFIDKKGQIQQK